ncbi:MAG: hypothetical protein NC406_09455 [Bacteroides sp.]|nr:hypothetical protein [Bacteroides sp.]
MWLYIRQLIQLVLSPSRGWEDISAAAQTPAEVQRSGYVPWLAVTAASELVPLWYSPGLTVWAAIESAIAVAGAMFVSVYLARIFLDMTLREHVDGGEVNPARTGVFVLYTVGLVCLYRVVANLLPATLTLVHFLPLLSVPVIFKAARYVGVKTDSVMAFTGLAAVAVIVLPMCMAGLLLLITH